MSQSTTKYIDYLKEDDPIPGQLWVCISFLSPEGIKNCSLRGLKIRGVYGTRAEADKRAEELQKKDADFHVFVGEMGKWLPWDPEPNDVKDQVYLEKELNDLMKGYNENQEKSKKMQQERKEDMIKQSAKEEQSRLGKTKARLRKKHAEKKQQVEIDHLVNRPPPDDLEINTDSDEETNKLPTEKEKTLKELDDEIKKKDEMLKAEKQRLNENQKEIIEKTQTVETIDSKLAKIQQLYEKLNKKK